MMDDSGSDKAYKLKKYCKPTWWILFVNSVILNNIKVSTVKNHEIGKVLTFYTSDV